MIKTFRFTLDDAEPSRFYLNQTACRALRENSFAFTVASHGNRRAEVSVSYLPEEGELLPISSALAEQLGLVAGIPYRLIWRDGEIRIGPVIGILAARRSRDIDLSPGALARLFLLRYPTVGGLVYLFGAEDVDLNAQSIDGYCFMPGEQDGPPGTPGPAWERARRLAGRVRHRAQSEVTPATMHPRTLRFRTMADSFLSQTPKPEPRENWHGIHRLGSGSFSAGRFPFPSALWRRAGFDTPLLRAGLIAQMGPCLLNSSFFDKESGHLLLSAHPALAGHLPVTERFTDLDQVFNQATQYGAVVLKRSEGNSGYGLMRLEQTGDGFMLRFREHTTTEYLPSRPALTQRLLPLVHSNRYLVQQVVKLPSYNGRLNDYRIALQKDDRGVWEAVSLLGRFGQRGSIVTNFINDGFALPAEEAIQCAFGADRREAFRLKEQLARFAIAVGTALDQSGGCYGDLGLDVALDTDRRIWLFEVNKLPFHELPLYAGYEQEYLDVKSGPLRFASYLAGFGRTMPTSMMV